MWINANPRPLTDAEIARIRAIKTELETLKMQQASLAKELSTLQRIGVPQLKIRYNFGKPPFPAPGDPNFPTDKIIDLGEFPLTLESPTE